MFSVCHILFMLFAAGTFKNLYSDHRSLFLRIPTDNNVIPFSQPVFSQESSPEKLSGQSTVATESEDNLNGNNVLCFCKTTQWKCKYCKIPTCDFCCVGQTAEDGNKRVCRRKNCNSLQ